MNLDVTAEQLNKIINGRHHSPIQDVVGDDYTEASKFTMTAGVASPFLCNGNVRNFKVLPSHVTNMWSTSENKCLFTELDNTPMMVVDMSFMFLPGTASAGHITISAYIDDATSSLITSILIPYKSSLTRASALLTFYLGSDAAFNVKGKGVKFTVQSDSNGEGYDPSIKIYRT